MKIQVNTDRNIQGDERLAEYVEDVVLDRLSRFRDQITRVEVHLSDENGGKSGPDDKRCVMEARVEGRQPTAVTHIAGSVNEAIDGAVEKLRRALDSALGKAHRPRP
ncbi:MAG: HPF/RaiA family ribosome-associated protein [Myxococcales bacterium]|nr:HPF/RaiA family ribosome-associated protein [Myxococcales bacterium]